MTINEIRELLRGDDIPDEVMDSLLKDPRKGVQKLLASYMRRLDRENAEHLRVEKMYEPESVFYKKGLHLVAGMDEVGRGPLAGPVTVAAVILPPHWFAKGLNDSKQVTPQHREELSEKIKKEAVAWSIVDLPPEDIDALNIYGATLTAMYQAVKNLPVSPEALVVDAMPVHLDIPVTSLVHGDALSASVAAASIVAKVHRDHLMVEYDKKFPGYGWAQNKGYGTKEHIEAIRTLGVTPLHRKSFEPVKDMVESGQFKINPGIGE
jgi:ribonuclease HII